jgi:hypothetical protein
MTSPWTPDPQEFDQQPIKGTEIWHQTSNVATQIVNRLSFSRDGAVPDNTVLLELKRSLKHCRHHQL